MILRLLLGSLLACACSFAAVAYAQLPPLTVSSCPRIDAEELERLLAIEFGTLGIDLTPVSEIRVSCDSERLEVFAQASSALPLRAEWSLGDADRASLTRLLALRISELLATPPAPAAAAPARATSAAASRAAPAKVPAHERRYALSTAASARRQGTPKTWLLGAAVAGLASLRAHLELRADLTFEAAQVETEYADVAWRQWAASVAVLWCMRTAHVLLGAGPGLRGAWVSLEAHDVSPSREARSLSAPSAGPLLLGHLAVHGRGPWHGVVDVEGGLITLPVHGLLDGKQKVLSVHGVALSAQLGVGYRW
jgi:hypothetical protein